MFLCCAALTPSAGGRPNCGPRSSSSSRAATTSWYESWSSPSKTRLDQWDIDFPHNEILQHKCYMMQEMYFKPQPYSVGGTSELSNRYVLVFSDGESHPNDSTALIFSRSEISDNSRCPEAMSQTNENASSSVKPQYISFILRKTTVTNQAIRLFPSTSA